MESDAAIKEIKEDLKNVKEKINEHDIAIVRLDESHKYVQQMAEEVVGVTKSLNSTMQNVQLAMVGIQGNMETLTQDMGDIKKRMDKFENDSSINILYSIKKNWITIVLAVSFVVYVVLNKYGIHI